MNEHHQSLPDEIQTALKIHDANKQAYLSIRERLENLRAREEKHRKTASAAEQQAVLDGATWRKLFRESDGVMTKDILNFKRQESDSRELGLEYTCLAGDLQPEMELCQIDTYEARERYLNSRETAFALYGDHCLSTAAAALFALPEAETFLQALHRKKLIIERNIEKDAFYREATFHDEKKAVSNEQARRLGEALFGFINQASVTLPVDNAPTWLALAIIPSDDFTTDEKELKNSIYRARRRSELKAMIEHHHQNQPS